MTRQLAGRVGRRVRAYRRASRKTQEQLAEAIGVTPETVSRLERGKTLPSVETLDRIASALGVELHELFNLRGNPALPSGSGNSLSRLVADLGMRSEAEIRFARDLLRVAFTRPKP